MSLFWRLLVLSCIKLMQLDILIFSSNEMNQVDERKVDNEDDAILDVDDEEERPSNANTHDDGKYVNHLFGLYVITE